MQLVVRVELLERARAAAVRLFRNACPASGVGRLAELPLAGQESLEEPHGAGLDLGLNHLGCCGVLLPPGPQQLAEIRRTRVQPGEILGAQMPQDRPPILRWQGIELPHHQTIHFELARLVEMERAELRERHGAVEGVVELAGDALARRFVADAGERGADSLLNGCLQPPDQLTVERSLDLHQQLLRARMRIIRIAQLFLGSGGLRAPQCLCHTCQVLLVHGAQGLPEAVEHRLRPAARPLQSIRGALRLKECSPDVLGRGQWRT